MAAQPLDPELDLFSPYFERREAVVVVGWLLSLRHPQSPLFEAPRRLTGHASRSYREPMTSFGRRVGGPSEDDISGYRPRG